MKTKNIYAGEIYISKQPTLVTTVVGSCIAFCVWDRRLRIGAMSHFALPSTDMIHSPNKKDSYYCGNIAIKALFREFKKMGSHPQDIVVKLAGGAKVLGTVDSTIGQRNIEMSREICSEYAIKIAGESVGGNTGTKVRFDTASGDLYIQNLAHSVTQKVIAKEHEIIAKKNLAWNISDEQNKGKNFAQNSSNDQPKVVNRPIRVLIVDDSKVIQTLFKAMLEKDEQFEIFGIANDPLEAENLMSDAKPDVITLDMQMPHMDGLSYLKNYLIQRRMPVIMVSGLSYSEGDLAFKALEFGAVDFVEKPESHRIQEFTATFKEKIRTAYSIKNKYTCFQAAKKLSVFRSIDPKKIVVIGSSTGGTVAIAQILQSLPDQIPPILIVQHIPESFSDMFARRLDSLVSFRVKEAEDQDPICPGLVLVAPGNKQMRIKTGKGGLVVEINDEPPVNRHKPSVDYFFDSVVKRVGKQAIGIILTGMGKDGAKGLLKLKNAGSHTIAQDEESCVVFGMPKEAIALGAATEVVSLDQLPRKLMEAATRVDKQISA